MSAPTGPARPGPRRRPGAPSGPDEVRAAVLDAAATLFALRGVDGVSLRDVAAEADVNLTLIRRYVGSRDDLIAAVFAHVSEQLARAVAEHPLAGQGHGPDTVMGRWVRIGAALAISGRPMSSDAIHNPSRRSRTAWSRATACLTTRLASVPRRSSRRPWAGGSSRSTSSMPPGWTTSRWRCCARSWCTPLAGLGRRRGRPRRIRPPWPADLADRQAGRRASAQLCAYGHVYRRVQLLRRSEGVGHGGEGRRSEHGGVGLERGLLHQLPAGVGEQRGPGAGLDPRGVQEDRRQVRLPALGPGEQLVPALHPQPGQPDPLRRALPADRRATRTSVAPACWA